MPDLAEVQILLRRDVTPILALDRGDVSAASLDPATGTVVLVYSGACAGCPGLDITHERLVAPLVRRAFPGIVDVVSTIEGEQAPADG